MKTKFLHTNLNVYDLDKSIAFYEQALGLKVERRISAPDGSFVLAFLGDGQSSHQLELTWLRDHAPYELGDNESHVAFYVEDPAAARHVHEEMGCICFENKSMGIYFIEDPDGYWLEIIK